MILVVVIGFAVCSLGLKGGLESPNIYNNGIVTIGERSVIPDGITVGKNSCIFGITTEDDFKDKYLASGKTLIKAGDDK